MYEQEASIVLYSRPQTPALSLLRTELGSTQDSRYLALVCRLLEHGDPLDQRRGLGLLKELAAQHSPVAAYNLSVCFHQGLGGERNLAKAAMWAERCESMLSGDPGTTARECPDTIDAAAPVRRRAQSA